MTDENQPAFPRSGERERADVLPTTPHASFATKRSLPKLPHEHYQGHAYVHWTLTVEERGRGWLTESFHQHWITTLLHTCARYRIVVPIYALMPDHAHLLCIGCDETADQRVAIEFLRRYLKPHLAPFGWQKQAHDHLLREDERGRGAFQSVAHYILNNPVRAGLVESWQRYPFVGCAVIGYPDLDIRKDNYWELFWRIMNRSVDDRSPRSRSALRF